MDAPWYVCIPVLAASLTLRAAAQRNPMGINILHPPVDADPIAREVRHELLLLHYYGVFDNLMFSVSGGVVTIYGQVTRAAIRNEAETALRGIEGVTAVMDKIEVLPPSDADDATRRDVFTAIYTDNPLAVYQHQAMPPMHIILKNAALTLVGVVDSQHDKELAYARAKSVPSVSSVTNNLEVVSPELLSNPVKQRRNRESAAPF
jgi:hyperosmotically inducible protein